MANHFGDRLCQAVKAKKTALIVGLDPVYSRLPAAIRGHRQMNDEFDAAAAVDALLDFCTQTLRIVAPQVAAVKINIAFFDMYLGVGIEAFYALLAEAEALGLETIGDIKRGDVGHTAGEYAAAHLVNSELAGLEDTVTPDAITINGFAGADGIRPFADVANQQGKGVFVWVRSSNPSAAVIQDFADSDGQRMYEKLAAVVAEIAYEKDRIGRSGYSNLGMIVGGTGPKETANLRDQYDKVWFLVPGYGFQGASATDCIRFCKADGTGALITASRSILYAYETPQYRDSIGDNWKKCIEQAVLDAKADLTKAMESKL